MPIPSVLDLVSKLVIGTGARSAKLPIQTIVAIVLLASAAYFSILDFSVPYSTTAASRSFEYVPGQGWSPLDVSALNASSSSGASTSQIPRYINAKLVFAGNPTADSVTIPSTIAAGDQSSSSQQELFVSEEDFDQWVSTVESTSYSGWRLRKSFSPWLWIRWNFSRLVALVKKTETFDLAVVGIAYLSMNWTFILLFTSMRKMGSRFLLFISVLCSSIFAFLFAYWTCCYVGVSISATAVSEGMPFLLAVIGFHPKIGFTRVVLRQAREHPHVAGDELIANVLTHDMSIFRDYVLIIVALGAAACSGVNRLWEFCFLSALTLLYDIFTFCTFYFAILSIKIEMIRIARNEIIRATLEEDGVSHAVAEAVADSSLFGGSYVATSSTSSSSSAAKSSISHTRKTIFQICMLAAAFFFANLVQFSDVFSFTDSLASDLSLSSAVTASLDKSQPSIVTIVPPLVFEHSKLSRRLEDEIFAVFAIWTRIVSDPLISKLLVVLLAVSVGLNGYLFNAARSGVVSPPTTPKARDPIEPTTNNKRRGSRSVSVITRDTKAIKDAIFSKSKSPASANDMAIAQSPAHSAFSDDSSSDDDNDSGLELSLAKTKLRSMEECEALLKSGQVKSLEIDEVAALGVAGKVQLYALEKLLGDTTRAVAVRRKIVSRLSQTKTLETSLLPYRHYDYDRVMGACCENVIGYVPIPVGVAGPLIIDGQPFYLPIATTEGCLVASTMRGCKAINAGGGVTSILTQDGMTRGPCVSFPSLKRAGAAKLWLDSDEGQRSMKKAFDSTSRFARLQSMKTGMAGRLLYIRFRTVTGDAMGMNMISKAVEYSLQHMMESCGFPDMEIVSLSGNYCIDKKPAAINWIEGRGKSVVAEARIPASVVKSVLKSDVDAIVSLNINKNLIGSALAGAMGGFNAHAANLVTAVFLATGQDPAQNVESSNCITIMNKVDGDLVVSVSMPCIEVGTIGGGTILEPQGAMLDLLGVRGPHPTQPGNNAKQLARIVASTVLAAEISLCGALAAGHLVQSHMAHNRKGGQAAAPAASAPNGSAQQQSTASSAQSSPNNNITNSTPTPMVGSCIKS